MDKLDKLNIQRLYPGERALLLVAKKRGLDVTKADVTALVSKNTTKQDISAAQPTKENIAAEKFGQSVASSFGKVRADNKFPARENVQDGLTVGTCHLSNGRNLVRARWGPRT